MIQPPIGAQGQGYHSCSRAGDLSTFGWPVPAHHSSDPTRKSPSQCTAAIFIAERNGGSPQLPYLGPPATAVPEFILVPSAHCHHLGHDPPCFRKNVLSLTVSTVGSPLHVARLDTSSRPRSIKLVPDEGNVQCMLWPICLNYALSMDRS